MIRATHLHFNIVKFIPVICDAVIVIHIVRLFHGVNSPLTELFAGSSLTALMLYFVSSQIFSFCWLHKLQIGYMAAGSFCIDFERIVGFKTWLVPMRWAMLGLGVIVILLTIVKFKQMLCCDYENHQGSNREHVDKDRTQHT